MTPRQEAEQLMGVATPAKVGRRLPAWFIHQAPSNWRRTMKPWVALVLGWILGSAATAAIIVALQVWKINTGA
jgi:hypothetical protein